jgi:hypothetical protein
MEGDLRRVKSGWRLFKVFGGWVGGKGTAGEGSWRPVGAVGGRVEWGGW